MLSGENPAQRRLLGRGRELVNERGTRQDFRIHVIPK